MTTFHIKVVSDNVCPFCYLGKMRLEKAINLHKKVIPGGSSDIFVIDWSAYQLDPSLAKTPVPVKVRMEEKFGADKLQAMNRRLSRLGLADGINFTSEGMLGNTRDSHRLIQLSKSKGNETENRVVSEVMRSYFEEGGDITSHKMLAAAAEKGGLDRSEVEIYLAGSDGGSEVDRECREAVSNGIRGVPNFLINGKYQVDGAQDVQTFLEALSQAKGLGVDS
ncbi:putative dsba oxidoreductase protein [Zalerion maritima]|uniref:Dsba oxidoreductase protein n=1 Tax=Zalerion maritima TaxID=339359 RepID=A0AAD5RSH6_9PEZI|nr:putative dsba oxidoreductase protein [Zalerion maritima]